jgi:hypothetical protein
MFYCLFACSQDKPTRPVVQEKQISKEESKDIVVAEIAADTLSSPQEIQGLLFNLKTWEDDFFYKTKIQSFNKDSIDHFINESPHTLSDTANARATPIIGLLHRQIEPDSSPEEWINNIHEGTGYLYSIQEKRHHIGITICQMNGGWVDEIKYLSFNLEGEKINEVVLAAEGGDGGYHSSGYGHFLNDSTYLYNFVDTEMNFETNEEEIIEQYSSEIIIHRSGKIESRKI